MNIRSNEYLKKDHLLILYSTLTDLNPGFDGPWLEHVTDIFCIWYLTKKKLEFHARIQKCHFARMEKFYLSSFSIVL